MQICQSLQKSRVLQVFFLPLSISKGWLSKMCNSCSNSKWQRKILHPEDALISSVAVNMGGPATPYDWLKKFLPLHPLHTDQSIDPGLNLSSKKGRRAFLSFIVLVTEITAVPQHWQGRERQQSRQGGRWLLPKLSWCWRTDFVKQWCNNWCN